jgi:hypothetical protein
VGTQRRLVQFEPQSRKARNIAANPQVVITTDNPLQPVVVEGEADRVVDHEAIEQFTARVNQKYRTEIAVEFFTENACFRLEPHRVFSLDESDFTGSPTRWIFGGGPPISDSGPG